MEKSKCIIVIEDESFLQQSLVKHLIQHRFNVFAYSKAEQAIESEILKVADAVVLDIKLPGINGWQATSIIKQNNADLPVLILTDISDLFNANNGLKTPPDDYITKPTCMDEFNARLKTILKRNEDIPTKRFYQVYDLNIDLNEKFVFRGESVIKLSEIEFNLLTILAEGNGLPIPGKDILKKIWKGNCTTDENTVETYINLIKTKIDKPFPVKLIHTKPGLGYFLGHHQ